MNHQFNMPFLKRLFIFLAIAFVCYVFGGILVYFVSRSMTTQSIRMATILQDIVIFILPPIATACIITRSPDSFLKLKTIPGIRQLLLATLALLASIPAMNRLVEWNNNITFPASLSGLEESMKRMEEAAEGTIELLIGSLDSPSSLIISIIIIGIMAGLSEELFFRGGLQRILATGSCGKHAAIWITAFIFSAIHMQFFGFFPRLLLGAFFGYLLWWSNSLWLPIFIHTLNNSLVVASKFSKGDGLSALENFGSGNSVGEIISIVVSIIAVTTFLILLYRRRTVE